MSSLNLFQTNKEPENPKTQVFENAEFGKIRVKGDSENPLFCLCGYLTSENMPYQRYLGAGYFEVKQSTYKTPYGEKSCTQTLITGKGQIYFCEKLRKEFK